MGYLCKNKIRLQKISQIGAICVLFFVVFFSANSYAVTLLGDAKTCKEGERLVPRGPNSMVCEKYEQPDVSCGFPNKPKEFVQEMREFCWFCEPLTSMVNSYQRLSVGIYASLTGAFLGLLGACFVIWIAIAIIRQVTSMKARSMPEFYTNLLKIALRVIFGAALLSIGNNLWGYTIGPMAGIVFEYGSAAMPDMPRYGNQDFGTSQSISVVTSQIVGNMDSSLGGICAAINAKIMEMIADSWIMMTAAMNDSWWCLPMSDGANFMLFVFGLFLLVAMLCYLFIVPLKFVDILFRLGLFMVLMPLFIFCWVFPITNSYFKNGALLLLNVMLSLLLLALTVTICTELILDAINMPEVKGDTFEEIKETFETSLVLDLSSAITLTAYLIFTFKILPTALELSNYFSDAYYGESGFHKKATGALKNIGGAVGKGVGAIAFTALTGGAFLAKAGIAKAGSAAFKGIKGAVKSVSNAGKNGISNEAESGKQGDGK